MKTFKEIEVGQLFKFNHLFWVKTSKETGADLSDDLYNNGKAQFFPNGTDVVFFKGYLSVKEVNELNKINAESFKRLSSFEGYDFEEVNNNSFKIIEYPTFN